MTENLTEAVSVALKGAFKEAQQRNNTEVTESHLLKAFLEDPQGYFCSILSQLNADPKSLLDDVQRQINQQPTFSSTTPQAPQASRNLQTRLPMHKIWPRNGMTLTQAPTILLSYWKNGGEPFAAWKQPQVYPQSN